MGHVWTHSFSPRGVRQNLPFVLDQQQQQQINASLLESESSFTYSQSI